MGTVYILMGTTDAFAEEPHYDILAVYQTMELAQEAYAQWMQADSDFDAFYIHVWQVRDAVESPSDYSLEL